MGDQAGTGSRPWGWLGNYSMDYGLDQTMSAEMGSRQKQVRIAERFSPHALV
jgi:hypothetical protein